MAFTFTSAAQLLDFGLLAIEPRAHGLPLSYNWTTTSPHNPPHGLKCLSCSASSHSVCVIRILLGLTLHQERTHAELLSQSKHLRLSHHEKPALSGNQIQDTWLVQSVLCH